MNPHKNTAIGYKSKKHFAIALVCAYVMHEKKLSGRGIARLLGIHHRTWQRYTVGATRPTPDIKYKIVRLMEADHFRQLIQLATSHYANLK